MEKDLLIARWPVVRKGLAALIDVFDEGDLSYGA